jgi:hypothetical protein
VWEQHGPIDITMCNHGTCAYFENLVHVVTNAKCS